MGFFLQRLSQVSGISWEFRGFAKETEQSKLDPWSSFCPLPFIQFTHIDFPIEETQRTLHSASLHGTKPKCCN